MRASLVLKYQKKEKKIELLRPSHIGLFFARVNVSVLRRDLGVRPRVTLLRWVASATSDDLDANKARERKKKKLPYVVGFLHVCLVQMLAFRLHRDRKDCDRRL